MKKILSIILTLFTSIIINGQTEITPALSEQLCPNQEYTFKVTNLPGNYSGIETIGNATITQNPGSGTTITFKGRFGDITGPGQGFKIKYSNNQQSIDFKFKKIKSLFGGYKVGANAPK